MVQCIGARNHLQCEERRCKWTDVLQTVYYMSTHFEFVCSSIQQCNKIRKYVSVLRCWTSSSAVFPACERKSKARTNKEKSNYLYLCSNPLCVVASLLYLYITLNKIVVEKQAGYELRSRKYELRIIYINFFPSSRSFCGYVT